MTLAPVILFVYDRPGHTLETLKALALNEGAAETELYIYADGPKPSASTQQLQNLKEVRNIIRSQKWCKKVTIIEAPRNKGLASSVIQGVSEVVSKFGKVIVLEDDLVTSPYFLTYMNYALDRYAADDRIASVNAYAEYIKGIPAYYCLRGGDCWGWATWDRAWKLFNPDGKVLYQELVSKNLVREFDFGGTFQVLLNQIQGKNSSWLIRWHTSLFLAGKLGIWPQLSFVKNIGTDGSGTHGEYQTEAHVELAKSFNPADLDSLQIEEVSAVKKKVQRYYLLHYYYRETKNRFKGMVYRTLQRLFKSRSQSTPH